MIRIIFLSAFLLATLTGCGNGGTKYVFDINEWKKNPEKYMGENPFAPMVCGMGGLVFSKEVQESGEDNIKNTKAEDLKKLMSSMTPTTIIVHENKIEWSDAGKETPIENGLVKFKKEKEGFKVIRDQGKLSFEFGSEKITCRYPFKEVD